MFDPAKKHVRNVVTGNENKGVRDTVNEFPEKAQKSWRKLVTGSEDTRIRDVARARINSFKKEMEQEIEKVQAKLNARPVIKLMDRISFFTGVMLLCLTEAILLVAPQYFWVHYSVVIPLILSFRFYRYGNKKWGFFCIDFCYFVNFSCLLNVLWCPRSVTWLRVNFVLSNGPLAIAAVAWRNSLVFHSLDKVTSFCIHIYPAILMYNARWFPNGVRHDLSARLDLDPTRNGRLSPLCLERAPASDGGANLSLNSFFPRHGSPPPCSDGMPVPEILGNAMLMYTVWQIIYLVITEILMHAQIKSGGYVTSLRWLMMDTRNSMNKAVLGFCRKVGVLAVDEDADPDTWKGKAIFVISQFLYTLATLAPTKVLYDNWNAHFCYLFIGFAVVVWNGASYYFNVFTVRYESSLPSPDRNEVIDDPDKAPKALRRAKLE